MNCEKMKVLGITLFLCLGFSHCAVAEEAEVDSSKNDQLAVGASTTQWLDTQREGRAAGNLLPIPGAEAGPSYQRYIDSFSTPIPDQLYSPTPASGAKR